MNTARTTMISLSVFLGVTLVGRFLPIGLEQWWIAVALACVGILVCIRTMKKAALPIAVLLLSVLLALVTIERIHQTLESAPLQAFATNEKHVVIGQIDGIPDIRPTNNRYVIRIESIDGIAAQGRVQVTDGAGAPVYEYGDRVQVTGKLRMPSATDTFDYPAFLKTQHIDALLTYGSITAAEDATLTLIQHFFRTLYRIRVALDTRIQLLLPEPHASLLIGFITGSRSGLPDDINTEFRITGTSHIVAVSGYNVTLVLAIASSLLWWMPVRRRFVPLLIGVVFYMLLTGAGAPVVRASIMGLLGLLALQVGRSAMPLLGLLWTATIMTLIDPIDLWFDPGLQLSFLAVLGLILLTPVLKKFLHWIPTTLGVQESLIATIAAQIATMPVSALTFRQFSLISPVTNVLVAPFIPLSMASGGLALLVSIPSLMLGLPPAYISWIFLEWILRVVHLTSQIPYAQLTW